MPLYVLVDELDRCRPPFAVAMLERVKHLFEADNVVFIVATNTEQLQHSVSAIYGASFNSKGYLNRFFDRTYRFAQPATSAFVASLVAQSPIDLSKVFIEGTDFSTFLADSFDQFAIGLRDIEQAYDLLRSVATVWDKKVPIELPVMLPFVIGQVTHIMPRMEDAFIQDLLAARPPQWKERTPIGVKLYDRRRDEFGGREVIVSPADLFSAYRYLSSTPLHKIFENSPQEPAAQYVYTRLRTEFTSLHGNVSHGDRPISIVREYPSIVAQAGRLSQ